MGIGGGSADGSASAAAQARRLRRRPKHRRADIRDSDPKQPWSCGHVGRFPPVESDRNCPVVRAEEEEGVEDCPGLEPFFFDEAEAIAEHERRTREEQEEELLRQREEATLRKIRVYDPKQGGVCSTRIDFVDLGKFDLDEESPLGPMRDTDAEIYMLDGIVCKGRKEQYRPAVNLKTGFSDVDEQLSALCKPALILCVEADSSAVGFRTSDVFVPPAYTGFSSGGWATPGVYEGLVPSLDVRSEEVFFPCDSANVLSVKIVSSDVGFPINVYGTVIARDMLDRKCVYLFRCDRDHSQLILTKEEQLILTGPKRGLALIDAIYFEIDLKIKGDGKQKKDKQLSKGYLEMKEVTRSYKDVEVESCSLDSMLSEVVVKYAVVKYAVEATIAIEVVQGKFNGEITAWTTYIQDRLVLHDSKLVSAEGTGVIPLLRCVVAVGLKEKLIMTIARAGVCKAERERTIKFTPSVNDRDVAEVTCGSVKMRVKVAWSIISRHELQCLQHLESFVLNQ